MKTTPATIQEFFKYSKQEAWHVFPFPKNPTLSCFRGLILLEKVPHSPLLSLFTYLFWTLCPWNLD